MKNKILLFIITITFVSCGLYSFSGASIDPEARTIYIQYFPNKASTIQPNLSQLFTEKLKDIFIEQTNLELSQNEGDLSFSGYISEYKIKPIGIQSNETASKNRLTIEVIVSFKSSINNKENFEDKFSRYKDYNSSENLSEIEENLIQEISRELVEDIFNRAVVNW